MFWFAHQYKIIAFQNCQNVAIETKTMWPIQILYH